MHLHSFCLVLTRLPVCISLALKLFQNKIFSDNAKIIGIAGDFKKVPVGGDCTKKVEDH